MQRYIWLHHQGTAAEQVQEDEVEAEVEANCSHTELQGEETGEVRQTLHQVVGWLALPPKVGAYFAYLLAELFEQH